MYLLSCLSLLLVCNESFFPLWWLLRFLPLSLVLSNLKTMRLGVYFFPICLELGIHGASWIWEFIDHFKFGNISIISSNILFALFLTSIPSTSWTHMYTLGCLELLSYSSLKLCSFLLLIFFNDTSFFSLCFLWVVSNASASSLFFSSAASDLP